MNTYKTTQLYKDASSALTTVLEEAKALPNMNVNWADLRVTTVEKGKAFDGKDHYDVFRVWIEEANEPRLCALVRREILRVRPSRYMEKCLEVITDW